eukprot:SAG11_NODE_35855_length_264_cov_1.260606_1_plen_31_part_01
MTRLPACLLTRSPAAPLDNHRVETQLHASLR